MNGMPAPDDEATSNLVRLLVRTPGIAEQLGPLLLANAINLGRADIVEQVYDNCYYLPTLARTEAGVDRTDIQSPLPNELIEQSLKLVDSSQALQDVDKMRLKHILSGQQMKEAEAAAQGPAIPHRMCRFFTWIVITLFFFLMTCAVIIKDGLKRNSLQNIKESVLLKDFSLFQNPPLIIMTLSVLMLSYIFLFFFLFIFDPKKGLVLEKRYQRGNAVEFLARQMSLRNEETGELDFQRMPYLMGLYDEICFESLLFKSPRHDYCRVMKQAVYDCHGYSRFFALSLNRQNFRTYVLFVLCLNTFFALCFLQIYLYQTHLTLKSSNPLLRLVELHVMSILGCFSSQSVGSVTSASSNLITKLSMAHLAVCLYLTEIFLSQCSHRLLVYLYAIGRQMTVLEVENPFLYARSR